MSLLDIRVVPETLRTTAFGGVGVNYAVIGSLFSHPIKILFIQNLTNAQLLFSFDGVNDHLTLPQNGHFSFDISTNKSNVSSELVFAVGRGVYVKRSGVPTSGSVYVTAFYAD